MKIENALRENVGKPELFTGREVLMDNMIHWVDNIREEIGKSRALLSRKKKGKTIIMQRLYNIVWTQNNKVIPFFYAIQEKNTSLADFAEDFLVSFLNQYLSFNSREVVYIRKQLNLKQLRDKFKDEPFLVELIETFENYKDTENYNALWETVREAPHAVATEKDMRVLQFLDEFQNINKFVLDKKDKPMKTLAGSYLLTAEKKMAPLFISGSYIGWLRRIISEMLPARFNIFNLSNLEKHEAFEMIFKYAKAYKIPINYENAEYILNITDGDPYYIAILFEGTYLGKKDYRNIDNITEAYEHEIIKGNIRATWLDYIGRAFKEVNNKNAKRIVLYLFSANGEERTRDQIKKDLNLDMSDTELEDKLKALVYADILSNTFTNYRYRISNDKIYELVFRNIYQEEIEKIGKDVGKALRQEIGKKNNLRGHFYEYLFEKVFNRGFYLNEISYNGPKIFVKAKGEIYRNYYVKETRLRNMEIDVYGIDENNKEIFVEVKSSNKKTGIASIGKYIKLKEKLETQKKDFLIIIYSLSGFTENAIKALSENNIYFGDETKYMIEV